MFFFRLPGEAMQIDRVMDAFAAHYCRQNPYLFEVFHIFTISHWLKADFVASADWSELKSI